MDSQPFTAIEVELAQALTYQLTLALYLSCTAEKAKQDLQQSIVSQERNRIARELDNSLKHLQEVLIPDNIRPSDDALNIAEISCSQAQGDLLQDSSPQESTQTTIHSVYQTYTQFESGTEQVMIPKILTTEQNKPDRPLSSVLELSPREREILRMIASGANNKEIATTLCLSEGTVRNYISHILSCLNVRDRTQAALIANTYSSFLYAT